MITDEQISETKRNIATLISSRPINVEEIAVESKTEEGVLLKFGNWKCYLTTDIEKLLDVKNMFATKKMEIYSMQLTPGIGYVLARK